MDILSVVSLFTLFSKNPLSTVLQGLTGKFEIIDYGFGMCRRIIFIRGLQFGSRKCLCRSTKTPRDKGVLHTSHVCVCKCVFIRNSNNQFITGVYSSIYNSISHRKKSPDTIIYHSVYRGCA